MTAATERQISGLKEEFNLPRPLEVCFFNAIGHLLRIHGKNILEQNYEEEVPQIWRVQFPDGDEHAYLSYKGVVYNHGVTYPDKAYPDFSLKEIKIRGQDITSEALLVCCHALAEYSEAMGLDFIQYMEKLKENPADIRAYYLILQSANLGEKLPFVLETAFANAVFRQEETYPELAKELRAYFESIVAGE